MRRELTPIKGTAGKEFDHLALRIDLEDIGLADLSFGDNFLEPLRLSSQPIMLLVLPVQVRPRELADLPA